MSRLYPCTYCTEDGYCKKYSDDEVTSWCVQGPCKDEKPSNADHIRAMTDEELADLLNDRAYPTKVWEGLSVGAFESAYDAWLWWLRQEET